MGRILRLIAIVLPGLAAVYTVLSGVGTTCVALAAERFGDSMAPLAPFRWLYLTFVVVTTAIGGFGIRATILLVRGRRGALKESLVFLGSGILVGAVHMAVSRALRGRSMPVDAVVYTTLLALAVLLVTRLPGLRRLVGFSATGVDPTGLDRGAAAIVSGVLCLTIHLWMGPTHTWQGVNYAQAIQPALSVFGWGLVVWGDLKAGLSQVLISRPLASACQLRKFPV